MTDIIQGSDEWFNARLGQVTASRMVDVMAKGRSGQPSATRATYMGQLAAERLSGTVAESFTSKAMEHGKETEAEARAAYAFLNDAEVVEVGYVNHPSIEDCGASPDGLVGGIGLVETKCPNSATHIATLLGKGIPRNYMLQMQWQLACTERQWCDFVSFDPRMPIEMQIHVERVERCQDTIDEMENTVIEFLNEMQVMVTSLTAKFNPDKEAA